MPDFNIFLSGRARTSPFCPKNEPSALCRHYPYQRRSAVFEDYGKEIYWNIEHLAGKGGLFGIVSEKPRKIFQKYPEEAYIALYFDGKNGSERKITLADKIDTEIVRIEAIIANGEKPSVSKKMTRYLSVIETVESPSAAENSANENEKKDTAEKTNFGKDIDDGGARMAVK